MSVDVGTVVYTNPLAPFGGAFRFKYQYDDAVSAVRTTRSTETNRTFSQIQLGPAYGRFSPAAGGSGSFSGSVVEYSFDLNLIRTQAANISGPGFLDTPSVVPTGLRNTLSVTYLEGLAAYNIDGGSTTSSYGCVFTRFTGAADIRNLFGNTVQSRLQSEGNYVGAGNRVMCLDGYAFDPGITTQSLFSETSARIIIATELLQFAPNFNPEVQWFPSRGGMAAPFSVSAPVGNVPLPGSLGLTLIGLAGIGLRALKK